MSKAPRFIVLESIDRGGKSTQIEALAEALRAGGMRVAITAYPAEDAPLTGHLITAFRKGDLALVPNASETPETQMLLGQMLFSLNRRERAQHLEQLLEAHDVVVSSRYQLSGRTYAIGKGVSPAVIAALHAGLEHDLRTPDLTLVIDADPDAVADRPRAQLDAFEADLALQRGVRAAYQAAAAADPSVILVDGIGTPAEVTERLLRAYKTAAA